MIITRRRLLSGACTAAAMVAGAGLFPYYQTIRRLVCSVPVLLYHRVGEETDSLTVSAQRFDADMQYLTKEGYHTLSLDDIRQRVDNDDAPLPSKSVLVTFDDGYLNNYTNAFPILAKYGLKASFYIITSVIGQDNRMTAAQIQEMAAYGMSFGSHTVSHRSLGELSEKEAKDELSHSKAVLEQLLGKAVDFVAYPCGSYRQETLQVAQQLGYRGGFSTRQGNAEFTNALAIRRIPIFRNDRQLSYVMLRKGLMTNIMG